MLPFLGTNFEGSRDAFKPLQWMQALEACIGLALASLGFAHLVRIIVAMTTTGLWSDEIVSIEEFSSQGLWTALTTYPAPNNHIFFSAMTSVLPWNEVYAPGVARFWSIIATLMLAVSGAWVFARQKSFIEAGILIHLLLMSHEFIALCLQARGYGFLALFALLSGLLAWRHEQDPDLPGAIVGIGALSWLGMWTMPSYVLFAAPLMASAAMSGPKIRNIGFGLATGAATLLVYFPVISDVLSVNRTYGSEWGHQLDTVDEVADALRLYLFDDASLIWGPNDTAIFLIWIGLAAFTIRRSDTSESRAAFKLMASASFLVAVAYLMGTPPPRILLPGIVAFCLASVLVFRDRLRPSKDVSKRVLFAVAIAAILIPHNVKTLRRFDFVPRERWKTIGEFIDHLLPENMPVAVPFRAQQLALYTDTTDRITPIISPPLFNSGRSAYLANGLDPHAAQLDSLKDSPFAAVRFKQNRGRHQTLHVAPAVDSLIRRLTLRKASPENHQIQLKSATDCSLKTQFVATRPGGRENRYFQLRAELITSRSPRSLFLAFEEGTTIGRVRVETEFDDGSVREIPDTQIFELGSTAVVDLRDGDLSRDPSLLIEHLNISVRPHNIDGERRFALREAWVYPERLGPFGPLRIE